MQYGIQRSCPNPRASLPNRGSKIMNRPLVLLVEDNPDDEFLLRDVFTHLPNTYRITTLKDGEAAVDYLSGEGCFSDRVHYPIPSLVLLDVNLPGMSGLEVLSWIRCNLECRDLAVVVLSGSKSPVHIQRAYDLGTNSYLIKPVNPRSLQDAIGLLSIGREDSFRVLLLDDCADDRALAADELRCAFPKVEIDEATGMVEMETAIECGEYDLVITDYQMHAINGLTVLRTVKALRPDCPVILYTGTGSELIAVEAMKSGLDDYLMKSNEKIARLAVSVRSVLGRTSQRRALPESEERFRMTFEQAAVGMAHVDPAGHYLRVNQRLCDILGYSREEMRCLTFQQITHPDDLERDLTYYGRLLAGDISTNSTEQRYVRKDGSFIWIQATASLVRDASGHPKYFISVVQDISERRRAEEALRLSEEQLRQSQNWRQSGNLQAALFMTSTTCSP